MSFRITGLPAQPFEHLFGLSDAELASHGALRLMTGEQDRHPDRIGLRLARPGETVLLVNHEHQCADTPYRSRHAIFVREHADATGCRVVLPAEPEAVLLGSAILGATAAGDQPNVLAAMGAMSHAGTVVEPNGSLRSFHDRKYRVFQAMYQHQLEYRAAMSEAR